jgi:hypothetical protein
MKLNAQDLKTIVNAPLEHYNRRAEVARQQRRVRMRLVEIFDDRQRLEQDRSVAVDQSGKRRHRVDCAVRRLALRALHEVHVDHLVRHDSGKVSLFLV